MNWFQRNPARQTLDLVIHSVVTTNQRNEVTHVNRAAERLWGRSTNQGRVNTVSMLALDRLIDGLPHVLVSTSASP